MRYDTSEFTFLCPSPAEEAAMRPTSEAALVVAYQTTLATLRKRLNRIDSERSQLLKSIVAMEALLQDKEGCRNGNGQVC